MKLYLTPEDGYFHQCLDPQFRCVYKLDKEGYYKCPVCIFKFPSIITLGSEKREKVIRYDSRILRHKGYEQLGRVPSVHKNEVFKTVLSKITIVIDV